MTTPKDQPFILQLPAGSRDKYETAIAAIPPDMRTLVALSSGGLRRYAGLDRAQVSHASLGRSPQANNLRAMTT